MILKLLSENSERGTRSVLLITSAVYNGVEQDESPLTINAVPSPAHNEQDVLRNSLRSIIL